MRFVSQRIKIIKYAAEQGVFTLDNLAEYLKKENISSSLRIALYDSGLCHVKYPNIQHGIWFLRNQDILNQIKPFYLPSIPSFYIRPLKMHLVDHALELNKIRNVIEQTNQIKVDEWWSENLIRALLPGLGGLKIAYDKLPDAIFWRRRTDGSRQMFFLEYERTFKNKERYKEIFKFYANHHLVKNKNVIYLCQDAPLKQKLEDLEEYFIKAGIIKNQSNIFQFITLQDFYQTYQKHNQQQEDHYGQQIKTLSQQTYA